MSAITLFAALYAAVLASLFAYGVNGYVLLFYRRRWRDPSAPPPERWPDVTVQIPVFNERDVVGRVLDAAASLRYPGRLDIQLLDDSTDDTPRVAAPVLARLGSEGVQVQHIRRDAREGFKAGALAEGLGHTDAELLLLLDADFVPPEDFLMRAVPLFTAPEIACVQTRWGHLNREDRPLTRGQALGIDVHFYVEQRARAAAGWPVAFNGSGGLWRRSAIEDAGGWSADTLTEDLDLSYRAWLRGWRTVYADEIECPAEIPERMVAFKAQQRRWARGSTAVARKLLGPIWRARASLGAKVQATLHLTHYTVHPLILLSAVLAIPLGMLTPASSSWWTLLPPLAMATGGPVAMAIAAAREEGRPRRGLPREIATLMLLGTGLALSNTIAVVAGLVSPRGVFERTPKGGRSSSYLTATDRLGIAEVALAIGCALLALWLVARGIYTMSPFLLLYAAGLGRVGVATLRESWGLGRQRAAMTEEVGA